MTLEEEYAAGVQALIAKDAKTAVGHFTQVIRVQPTDSDAWAKLGQALWGCRKHGEAINAWREAVSLDPTNADAQMLYSGGLQGRGYHLECMPHIERALAIAPSMPHALWARAHALMALGHLREGLEDYKFGFVTQNRKVRTLLPAFTGEDESVLVWGEQGIGDQIFFARWAYQFHGHTVAHVTIEVYRQVYRLLACQNYGKAHGPNTGAPVTVVCRPDDAHMPWACESAMPMMECPLWLPTDWMEAKGPYIKAPGIKVYPKDEKTVAIVWRGNPSYDGDSERSLKLEQVVPIIEAAQKAGYKVVSFQVPLSPEEIETLEKLGVEDWGQTFADWSCTADAMMAIDHLVTVSTGVSVLAGAMGIPSKVLLPDPADWRWYTKGTKSDTSPWIEEASLFWQIVPGDWSPVIQAVCESYNVD